MSFEIVLGNRVVTNLPENKETSADEQNISNSEPEKPHNHEAIQKMIDSNNVLLDPWNKCRYKSDIMEYTVKDPCGCRSPETRLGHTCLLLGILDLNPLHCSLCKKFTPREENQ